MHVCVCLHACVWFYTRKRRWKWKGSFFFRVEFCLRNVQRRKWQGLNFEQRFSEVIHNLSEEVFDIWMLKLACFRHIIRHVKQTGYWSMNNTVTEQLFTYRWQTWTWIKRHLSIYCITSLISLCEYCATGLGCLQRIRWRGHTQYTRQLLPSLSSYISFIKKKQQQKTMQKLLLWMIQPSV